MWKWKTWPERSMQVFPLKVQVCIWATFWQEGPKVYQTNMINVCNRKTIGLQDDKERKLYDSLWYKDKGTENLQVGQIFKRALLIVGEKQSGQWFLEADCHINILALTLFYWQCKPENLPSECSFYRPSGIITFICKHFACKLWLWQIQIMQQGLAHNHLKWQFSLIGTWADHSVHGHVANLVWLLCTRCYSEHAD